MNEIRDADLTRDLPAIRNLWLEYLTWGNDEMEARHGFRLPVHETVERTMLDRLIEAARSASYGSIRLDSPDFMTAAHALYRSSGFVDIEPYPESEIPDEYKAYWVFMERTLR